MDFEKLKIFFFKTVIHMKLITERLVYVDDFIQNKNEKQPKVPRKEIKKYSYDFYYTCLAKFYQCKLIQNRTYVCLFALFRS